MHRFSRHAAIALARSNSNRAVVRNRQAWRQGAGPPVTLRHHAPVLPCFNGIAQRSFSAKKTEEEEGKNKSPDEGEVVKSKPDEESKKAEASSSEESKPEQEEKKPEDEERKEEGRSLQTDNSTARAGPINWKTVLGMVLIGIGGFAFQQYLLKTQKKKAGVKKVNSIGKPLLGGPFNLIDEQGKAVTDKDFHGQYVLLYFGFTYCPDICPTEMIKMQKALATVEARGDLPEVLPLFITIDPERDTVERFKEFRKTYHPKTVYLTGPLDEIDKVSKEYRVYYSIPTLDERLEASDDGMDYLVDHTIFFYLLGKEGQFLEYFGKNMTASEVSTKMIQVIKDEEAKALAN